MFVLSFLIKTLNFTFVNILIIFTKQFLNLISFYSCVMLKICAGNFHITCYNGIDFSWYVHFFTLYLFITFKFVSLILIHFYKYFFNNFIILLIIKTFKNNLRPFWHFRLDLPAIFTTILLEVGRSFRYRCYFPTLLKNLLSSLIYLVQKQ